MKKSPLLNVIHVERVSQIRGNYKLMSKFTPKFMYMKKLLIQVITEQQKTHLNAQFVKENAKHLKI